MAYQDSPDYRNMFGGFGGAGSSTGAGMFNQTPTNTTQVQPFSTTEGPTTPATSTAPVAPANQAPAASGGAWGAAGSPTGWLNQELQNVQSTDDPGYWAQQAAKDPKFMAGDPGAMAWWKDAIQRGDGSALVKNGTLTTRGGGGAAPGASQAGNGWFASGGAAPSSYTGGGSPAPVAAGRGPQWDAFYNQLLGRSTQSLAVNPNDPIIKANTDAFNAAEQRQQTRNMSALAERAGPNTNLAAETRASGEQVGQDTAAFQAKQMGDEVAARRQEISQALTLQAGQLSTEEMSRLKQEDQALAARQQDLQNSQFGAQYGLASQNQGWMQAFQDRGWGADQAQRAWDDQYKTLFG